MDDYVLTHFLQLTDSGQQHLIRGGLKGIEKESLRITEKGVIAQTPHPHALGATLTHPHITTDYSESLLEFITPPFAEIDDSLNFLHDIHQHVYANLNDEFLLASSMPCAINGDESIALANYGSSNVGQMKHIYRRGLGYRYGRSMQAISGIHFNYSVPETLWPVLQQLQNNKQPLEEFISSSYFGMVRNFLRQGWLILYLFGASPAICKSFFKSRPELGDAFDEFDRYTFYHPYATSLRMSDIGYKSTNQANLEISYNSLTEYTDSLGQAIETPYPDYEKIGVKVDGEYRQLNSNALQIENEFYSIVRPKQIANSGEKPTLALKRRGVKYIEVRSLDLDLFNPIGINQHTGRFLEAFLLTCLFQESPYSYRQDQITNNQNQLTVAHEGRKPGLTLIDNDQHIPLKDWAHSILNSMSPICHELDSKLTGKPYQTALNLQRQVVDNPDLAPSAKILEGMRQTKQPFARFALDKTCEHAQTIKTQTLNQKATERFEQCAEHSHLQQIQIEKNDTVSFDTFLENYFAQN